MLYRLVGLNTVIEKQEIKNPATNFEWQGLIFVT